MCDTVGVCVLEGVIKTHVSECRRELVPFFGSGMSHFLHRKTGFNIPDLTLDPANRCAY